MVLIGHDTQDFWLTESQAATGAKEQNTGASRDSLAQDRSDCYIFLFGNH